MPSPEYAALEERLAAGDKSAATAILALAGEGDADALLKSAELRMRGIGGPVDLADAFELTARAARSGLVEARRAEIALIASGLGRRADPALALGRLEELARDDRLSAIQLAMLRRMGERRVTRTIVSRDPRITVFHGLLDNEECRYVQLVAAPWLEPAMITAVSGEGVRDPHRDSDNMVVTPLAEDLVIQAFLGRIADVSGAPVANGEPLHVLRYRPGQQYRPHHDAHSYAPVAQRRHHTAILYLNNDYDGGETAFPELGLKVRGVTGDLLLFDNLDSNGNPDPRMMHAGEPVTAGEKWIATRWIRGSDYFGREGSSSDESP